MPDIRRSHLLDELNRHKAAVVRALGRLSGLPADKLAPAEQTVFERIAFLVSFILANQQLRDAYLSMLDLPCTWADQPNVRRALFETRGLISKAVDAIEHAGLRRRRVYRIVQHTFEAWMMWTGSFSDLVGEVRKHLKEDARHSLPERLLNDYRGIVLELEWPERELLNAKQDDVPARCRRFKLDVLEDLVGFGMRYAGCAAAQLLACGYLKCCPSGLSQLAVSPLSRLLVETALRGRGWPKKRIDAPEMELAVDDVCARLEAVTTSRAQRSYFTNRLTTFFTMYGKERIRQRLNDLARTRCTRYEERIFRPLVEELAFDHGLFALPEAQLSGDRPDIVMQDLDVWYVYELKQLGFGSGRKTEGKTLALLTEALSKSHSYREKLSQIRGIQNDVYILLFVNGQASFVDDDRVLGSRHVVERDGISYQLQLVNVPLDAPTHIRVQVSKLDRRTSGPHRHRGSRKR